MSIVRLSAIRERLYAPDRLGNLIDEDFKPASLTGRLGAFAPDTAGERAVPEAEVRAALLDRYLKAALAAQAADLEPEAPVVVMVHGFLFDPRQAWRPNPADSDNPHCRIFHFLDLGEAAEIREHTAGWPRQLGFADGDGAAQGLAVAFGWTVNPGSPRR